MPTTRHRRSRRAEPDAIAKLRAGLELEYSEESWYLMIEATYFGQYDLSPDEVATASAYLREWFDVHNPGSAGRLRDL